MRTRAVRSTRQTLYLKELEGFLDLSFAGKLSEVEVRPVSQMPPLPLLETRVPGEVGWCSAEAAAPSWSPLIWKHATILKLLLPVEIFLLSCQRSDCITVNLAVASGVIKWSGSLLGLLVFTVQWAKWSKSSFSCVVLTAVSALYWC